MQLNPATYSSFSAVTPSDTIRVNCRAIYVAGTGDVAVSVDGTTAAVTFKTVPGGAILPISLDGGRIMATGTTASTLLALA